MVDHWFDWPIALKYLVFLPMPDVTFIVFFFHINFHFCVMCSMFKCKMSAHCSVNRALKIRALEQLPSYSNRRHLHSHHYSMNQHYYRHLPYPNQMVNHNHDEIYLQVIHHRYRLSWPTNCCCSFPRNPDLCQHFVETLFAAFHHLIRPHLLLHAFVSGDLYSVVDFLNIFK